MKNLKFISRHTPNDGEIATAKKIGFAVLEQIEIVFTDDPVADLLKAGVTDKALAIVAPTYICNRLLNKGYTLYSFVNIPAARQRGVFVCKGVYKMHLYQSNSQIIQKFVECPIPIDLQSETEL